MIYLNHLYLNNANNLILKIKQIIILYRIFNVVSLVIKLVLVPIFVIL